MVGPNGWGGHRALTPCGLNEGNWQMINPPFDHVIRSHAWDSKPAWESDQGNKVNGGVDVGKGDPPPLPTLHPVTNGQSGRERGGGLLVHGRERGVQPTHEEGWTQTGSQRGKARGKEKEKEKAKPKKPAWVDAMKAMRSDTARKDGGSMEESSSRSDSRRRDGTRWDSKRIGGGHGVGGMGGHPPRNVGDAGWGYNGRSPTGETD